jgi:hypothetical protein
MESTKFTRVALALIAAILVSSCNETTKTETTAEKPQQTKTIAKNEVPDYFMLRPEIEKAYGYTHALKIGNDIKISGAVSMDDEGNPTAVGDMEQTDEKLLFRPGKDSNPLRLHF